MDILTIVIILLIIMMLFFGYKIKRNEIDKGESERQEADKADKRGGIR